MELSPTGRPTRKLVIDYDLKIPYETDDYQLQEGAKCVIKDFDYKAGEKELTLIAEALKPLVHRLQEMRIITDEGYVEIIDDGYVRPEE